VTAPQPSVETGETARKAEGLLLSLVIPTYNERGNIERLLNELGAAFKHEAIAAEIIIVDDNSPDGTGELVEELLRRRSNLRVIHRRGKLGLATAVTEGFARARGEFLAVMDADFSHPPDTIPRLVKALIQDNADIAIGSRDVQLNSSSVRSFSSTVAIWFARPLTPVRDPTTGLFALRRSVIEGVPLNPLGFKILLEILVKGRYRKVKEIPFTFGNRWQGKSKYSFKEILAYLRHCLRLYLWRLRGR
jgi:dolichol-phosphate mannosyltransferase